jgi:hypothetical protein
VGQGDGAFGAVVIIAYHPYGLPMDIWVTLPETGLAPALPFALVLLVTALPLPLAACIWSARWRASFRRGAWLVIPASCPSANARHRFRFDVAAIDPGCLLFNWVRLSLRGVPNDDLC